jgi:hypothetical protein
MQVIGAGFGRTGTLSLKVALEMLGFGKCYHMEELIAHPEQVTYWEALYAGQAIRWQELFAGYESTVDFPGYRVYGQLFQQYPQAKVILNTRAFEPWYESAYQTIYKAGPSLTEKLFLSLQLPFSPRLRKLVRVFRLAEKAVWQGDFKGRFADKAFAREVFENHHREVKRRIPAHQLLEYQVNAGWEPLCRFLDVPVPDQPFPRVNEQQAFGRKRKQVLRGKR